MNSTPKPSGSPLLELERVCTYFPVRSGVLKKVQGHVKAVDDVSLGVRRGEVVGLVGESGSGKTTLGRTILRLIAPTSGTIRFGGADVTNLEGSALRSLRRKMQVVFQDSAGSLDPRLKVADCVMEPLLVSDVLSRDRRQLVDEALDQVGLDPSLGDRYPHELSGGQRQRANIARALIVRPDFIVADEPVAALDISVQAQVLNTFGALQSQHQLSYLFISHDLAVVDYIADRIAVMYLGKLVEIASPSQIRNEPLHPYTRALISAIPRTSRGNMTSPRIVLQGDPPDPSSPPVGCNFSTRCPIATALCRSVEPALVDVESGRSVACHYAA